MLYPWHERVFERICSLHRSRQLSHAIALTSTPGWGIEQLADRITLRLLQLDGGSSETLKPARETAHLDLRWLEPDGAVIKVEEIRAITEFAIHTAQVAAHKVAVILRAETMNANAANALLKTLEEPPANTVLILVTEAWGRLPATVRSRCQRFASENNPSIAQRWLQTQKPEVTADVMAEFGYAPVDLAVEEELVSISNWLDASQREFEPCIAAALEQNLGKWLARWYRYVLWLVREAVAGQAAHTPQLISFADNILDVRRQILTTNSANSRLLLEYLLLLWRRIPA